jgi:hypothetical protein
MLMSSQRRLDKRRYGGGEKETDGDLHTIPSGFQYDGEGKEGWHIHALSTSQT